MQRRQFLKSTAAVATLAGLDLPTFAKKVKKLGPWKLRIGVLSDIHIKNGKPETIRRFEKALTYFRDKKVDGVLIAGDMADHGTMVELRAVGAAWDKVFPDDTGADGQHVEKLFIYGNHDVRRDVKGEAVSADRAAAWQECFHEPWAPIYIKEVKGYKFIGGHFVNTKNMPGLAEFLSAHDAELAGDKPFFYFQHTHPKGTCSAPWTWGQDGGEVTELLSRYPNAVSLSGHSHTSLTDERTIWQGAFTSIGTASLSYIIPFGGRENSIVFASKDRRPSQMKVISCRDGHQGQIMTVYDSHITLEKHEFEYDEDLCDSWIIPLGGSERPLSFEARAEKAVAPQFAKGAAVTTEAARGDGRFMEEHDQIKVLFPAATSGNGTPRAFDYEVCIEVQDVDTYKTVLTKRVFSKGYFLGEAKDAETPVECLFGLEELPADKTWRFAVRPVECFGHKGEPIVSQLFTPEKD